LRTRPQKLKKKKKIESKKKTLTSLTQTIAVDSWISCPSVIVKDPQLGMAAYQPNFIVSFDLI